MAFRVIRDGVTIERHLGGPRTLAEILTKDERSRFENGTLVALTAGGGLMSFDSPLAPDQAITLRVPQPENDLAGFGFPINRAGDVVSTTEMLAIRRYEESRGEDVYELPLAEIRVRLKASEPPPSVPPGFFDCPLGTLQDLKKALGAVLVAPSPRRKLPALGRRQPVSL